MNKILNRLSEINLAINKIDYALMQVDYLLQQEFIKHPECINYNVDPDIEEKHIICEYPLIHISCCPFKTSIKYEEIFKRINDENYDTSVLIKIILELLYEKIPVIDL